MAATFTTSCTFTELTPNAGIKEIMVIMPTGASGDGIRVTLADYGISLSGMLAISGFVQTTPESVVAVEQPTTFVSAGVLSISSLSGTGKKYYRILGKSN